MRFEPPGGTSMTRSQSRSFRFEYRSPVLRFGAGCVEDLADELEEQGIDAGLVVTGKTVGSTPAVMDPVRAGLDDRLAGVFDETTPAKTLGTAWSVVDALREHDADALVAVGGGSSLDVATVASVLAGTDDAPSAVGTQFAETGTIPIPDGDLSPVVAIPTTLAGAELSQGAGITADPATDLVDDHVTGGISDPRVKPAAVFHDPGLVATTPQSILAASAMNGFDKAIESTYARTATPITDATATRALEVLAEHLPVLGAPPISERAVTPVLEGILLAQYGISRPDANTLSLIHSFGHALTGPYDVQQGAAHAIVAPHALDYLLERVDTGTPLLLDAFGVDDAAGVVDAVREIRDAMGLPSRLRTVDGPARDEFGTVAQAVLDDPFMQNAPHGLAPTARDIEAILEAAY